MRKSNSYSFWIPTAIPISPIVIFKTIKIFANMAIKSICHNKQLSEANVDWFWCQYTDLGTSILGAQIKKEESTCKEKYQTGFKFYHFKPIYTAAAQIIFLG